MAVKKKTPCTDCKDKTNKSPEKVKQTETILKAVSDTKIDEQRVKLEKFFPYLRNVKRELIEAELELVKHIKDSKKVEDVQGFFMLYNEVMGAKLQACQCPGIIAGMVEKLVIIVQYQEVGHDTSN